MRRVGLKARLWTMASDDQLRFLQYSQRNVLSRAQAESLGFTPDGIRHRIRPGGPWQRLLPGAYLTATGEPSWEQRAIAAMLYAGQESVITGLAALRGLDIRAPQTELVDVLVPASHRGTSHDFAVLHRTNRMPSSQVRDLALQFAPPPRAIADAVRGLADVADVRAVVAGAVQRRKCHIADLAAELEAGPIRGSARLRAVLAEVADGVRSAAEAEFRELIVSSSLPVPIFNPVLLLDGQFLAQPDAWWPEAGVAAEVDSREWHLLPEHWEITMTRGRRMAAAGIIHLHFSPREMQTDPDGLIVQIQDALRRGRPLPGISWQAAAA
jgi:hypothetical protein